MPVLAIDRHTEAGNLLFTDSLDLRVAADEPCHLNVDARNQSALESAFALLDDLRTLA